MEKEVCTILRDSPLKRGQSLEGRKFLPHPPQKEIKSCDLSVQTSTKRLSRFALLK
jgi:hypothetical protein